MSKYLNTETRLPDEAPTVEGRLADIMENAEVVVDEYHLSDADRARVVAALRGTAMLPDAKRMAEAIDAVTTYFDAHPEAGRAPYYHHRAGIVSAVIAALTNR